MKFTALEVTEGDSFLLEYKDIITEVEKKILIDGGTDVDLVLEKNPVGITDMFIDMIVCTHYDNDHISGIFNLLEKGYRFSELWLPDKIRGVGEQLKHNGVFRVLEDVFDATLAYIQFLSLIPEDDSNRENIENRDRYKKSDLLNALEYGTGLKEDYEYYEFEFLYQRCSKYHDYISKIHILEHIKTNTRIRDKNKVLGGIFIEMLETTIKVCKLIVLPAQRGTIRWMKYEDCYMANKPSRDFPILAMNCSENFSNSIYYSTLHFLLEYKSDTILEIIKV